MPGGLLAIGGKVSSDGAVLRHFYNNSGGAEGNILILPTASTRIEPGEEVIAALASLGLRRRVEVLTIFKREQAMDPDLARRVRQASGIFLLGGNQMRLTATLGGTLLQQELLAAHQAGLTVAGTSAGATALSKLMIAYGRNGAIPRRGSANIIPGLGFTDGVIFDQHFRQRHRFGRLIYAVACNPGYLGIGIDEDTAAWVVDGCLEVVGRSAVTIVDGEEIEDTNVAEVSPQQVVAVSGIRLHLLNHGCKFDLRTRRATLAIEKIESRE
jgi:cyanophycinase